MEHRPYMHVEKFGNDEVQGIELGEVYVFPKLDGTNASVWSNHNPQAMELGFGSRQRTLSLENDNAGFMNAMHTDIRIVSWFADNPKLRLYGEWLVPHTLKTYRDDAWRKFYVFDVFNDETETYMDYNTYKPLLDKYGLDYLPPLAILTNGEYDRFIHVLGNNNFYVKDGEGNGEGIVLKNFSYYNPFGRQIWAKIVSSEFKEKHYKEMGAPESELTLVEETIANECITQALCEKEYAKIKLEKDGWTSKYIPELLGRVYHAHVTEDIWNVLKQHKDPTINFKTLKHFITRNIKLQLPTVF